MFQRLLTLAALVCIGTQAPSGYAPQKPQPAPEHQKLEFFVGRWQVESQEDSGAKSTATTTCEWFEGHFQVVCRSDVSSTDGNSKELESLTYDANIAEYTRYHIASYGKSAFGTRQLEGKTWRWHGQPPTQGPKIRYDFSWTETSADSYVSEATLSIENGPPKTILRGKAIRMK